MPNGIQKEPETVSERKTDPGGVRRFEARHLGIAFGVSEAHFSNKNQHKST